MTASTYALRHTPAVTLRLVIVLAIVSTSSIVFFEPAPYDYLSIAAALGLFVFGGLRIPSGLGIALLLLTLFILANFLSGMAAAVPSRAIFYLSVSVYLILTWLLFTCLIYEDPPRVISFIWAGYTVAAIIAVAIGIGSTFGLVPGAQLMRVAGRAQGLFKDPNVFGPFLVPVILYMFTVIEGQASKLIKLGALGLSMVLMFGVFFSYSRAAWANLALCFGIFYTLRFVASRSTKYRIRTIIIALCVGGLASVVLAWAISQPQVSEMVSKRAHLIQRYDSERFGTQAMALNEAATNPIGIGPGHAEVIFQKGTHNVYLRVLAENGWLGAIGFFGFVALTLGRSLMFLTRPTEVQPTFIVALTSAIGVLGNSVVIDSLHWRHLWLLFAIMWGVMLAYRRRPPSPATVAMPAGRRPS